VENAEKKPTEPKKHGEPVQNQEQDPDLTKNKESNQIKVLEKQEQAPVKIEEA